MKSLLVTIKDCSAGVYNPPINVPNELVLKREIRMAVNDPGKGNLLSRFPEDHQVFSVGEFDSDTGEIISHDPKFLFHCIDCVEVRNE